MSQTVKFQCVDNGTPFFLIDSVSGIYNKNTRDSTNASTASVLLYGGLSINTTTNSSSATNGGAMTIAGGMSIGKDVYIGGNLTVLGTQTQIISQTIKVADNLIVLNASPISGRDAGILFERYQTENDINIGDIITDTPVITGVITSCTNNTVVINTLNSIDNYYNNFFIKINNQTRKIISYDGTTKTCTLNTPFTTLPNNGDLFTLYNNIYASLYYKENNNHFVLSYTSVDPGATNISNGNYISLDCASITIYDTTDTTNNLNSIGSLVTLGGISVAKSIYVGNNIYGSLINTLNGSFTNITSSNTIVTNMTSINTSTSNLIVGTWLINNNGNNLCFKYNNDNLVQISTSGNMNISGNITVGNINSQNNVTIGSDLLVNGNSNFISSQNTFGSIYTNGQFVGINTVSPSYTLDVTGNGHVSGDLYIDGNISSSSQSSTTFAYLTLTSTDNADNLSTGSLITFGGIVSQSDKDASSVSNGGTILTNGGMSIKKRLFIGGNLHALSNSNTVGTIYTTNGNVGINNTAPQYTLDVNNTIRTNSIIATSGNITNINTTNTNSTNNTLSNCILTNNTVTNSVLSNSTINNTLITNISCSNFIVNNDTIDSVLKFKNDNDWSLVSLTSGTFNIQYNKVTNTTINTNGNISFTKDVFINSTSGLLNTNPQSVSGASLNISGDTLLSGSNKIFFSQTGLGAPSSGSRSIGTKIVLRPEIGINTVDYAIGVETNNLWMSSNSGFKWYTLTNNTLNLNSSGCLNINCTTNASGIGTGGSLNVEGGGSIKKDLYIGGSLYVNGQNSTSISGLTTIGSYSDTSVYQIVISIEKTMPNTNYKVIGNLTTISNNSNTYIVSFSNLTTTTFTANILRLDSLFSGWTDDNLNLSWTVLF